MHHYICKGGCKGVSENPGVCKAQDCPRHGQPLEACTCQDNMHEGAFGGEVPPKEEESGTSS